MTAKACNRNTHTRARRLEPLLAVCALSVSLLLAQPHASANESTSDGSDANGGFLEVGLVINGGRGARHNRDPEKTDNIKLDIGLDLSAGYRFRRLFFEASESSFAGLNAGITLVSNENWTFDLLLANIAGNITVESDEPPAPTTEEERNEAILDRDSLYIAGGGRLTGHFGDNIVQFRLLSDWYDGNGMLGSINIGRQWQIGNWNTQLLTGVRYVSREFSDYQYGVDVDEQSQRFAAYEAGAGWIPEVEATARLPIGKNWVFSSRMRYRSLPDAIADSPLINRADSLTIGTGIHYVF